MCTRLTKVTLITDIIHLHLTNHQVYTTESTMTLDLSIGAASKLEPFILMSKGAKGAAAAKLIQDATSAPGVFVFSELLDMPSIQEVHR